MFQLLLLLLLLQNYYISCLLSYIFAALLQSYLRDYLRPLASLMAQTVKNLPVVWETWIQSLDWDDPLEKEMATHSSILAWKIPWPRCTRRTALRRLPDRAVFQETKGK